MRNEMREGRQDRIEDIIERELLPLIFAPIKEGLDRKIMGSNKRKKKRK